MDRKRFGEFLTKGLMHGYASGGVKPIERAGFTGKASLLEFGQRNKYYDEWFANHTGGGQELVSIGNQAFTRLYAGGTPEQALLDSLGVTKAEVGDYLRKKIIELKEATRLFATCTPPADGDWHYSYTILDDHPAIAITVAKERITYKGTDVHIHIFTLCPVR